MNNDVTRMQTLALEIATLERQYRALYHRMDRAMDRARARWNREKYERAEAAQRALGTSEGAVCELADLLSRWGLAPADLATIVVTARVVGEVNRAFEGWEIDRCPPDGCC